MFNRPYHPANLKHQPYPHWKVKALAWVGATLGIQFNIDGIPLGAPYHYRPDFVQRASNGYGTPGCNNWKV